MPLPQTEKGASSGRSPARWSAGLPLKSAGAWLILPGVVFPFSARRAWSFHVLTCIQRQAVYYGRQHAASFLHSRAVRHRKPGSCAGGVRRAQGNFCGGGHSLRVQVELRQGEPQLRRGLSRRGHEGRAFHSCRSAREPEHSRAHRHSYCRAGRARGRSGGLSADAGLPLPSDRSHSCGRFHHEAGQHQEGAVPCAVGNGKRAQEGPFHG